MQVYRINPRFNGPNQVRYSRMKSILRNIDAEYIQKISQHNNNNNNNLSERRNLQSWFNPEEKFNFSVIKLTFHSTFSLNIINFFLSVSLSSAQLNRVFILCPWATVFVTYRCISVAPKNICMYIKLCYFKISRQTLNFANFQKSEC